MTICCLFHFSQSIIKKLKQLKIINKKFTYRGYKILRNIEILCFIESKNNNTYFKFLKEEIFVNELEKKFMSYFEKYWLKKFYNFFNYSHLIKDIIKLKNLFVNTK